MIRLKITRWHAAGRLGCAFLAGFVLLAGSAATASAQLRHATAMPSHATLRAACDRALERRGRADASAAVRARCVAGMQRRIAIRRQYNCFFTRDPRHRGWSPTAHGFRMMAYRNRWQCPVLR